MSTKAAAILRSITISVIIWTATTRTASRTRSTVQETSGAGSARGTSRRPISSSRIRLLACIGNTLVQHGCKYLLIGNMNSVTYKEIFPYIKNNEMWLGINAKGGTRRGNSMFFADPDTSSLHDVTSWWFTNMDHKKRHEELILTESYYDNPSRYPKYDNYDAINVDKTKDIPKDYYECIGVPISFLDKYDPEQFEIVGATESEGAGFSNGLFDKRESETAFGTRQESLQANLYQEKIKITRFRDGTYKILPQLGLNLREFCSNHIKYGFKYESGIIGVPISFLDKYNDRQFEILMCCEPAIPVEVLHKNPNFREYKSRQVTIDGVLCQKTYHRILVRRCDVTR